MPILNLGPVVNSFALPGGITVERRLASSYDDFGFPVHNPSDLLQMTAVVHNATPADLQMLPEGERVKETIIVFTRSPLLTGDTSSKDEADVVRYNNKRYRVLLSENWLAQSGHYRCWAQRIEEQ
jgi:hypothetical protein